MVTEDNYPQIILVKNIETVDFNAQGGVYPPFAAEVFEHTQNI